MTALQTDVHFDFADGRYRFWLDLPQIKEFEAAHGSLLTAEANLRRGIGLDQAGKPIFVGGGALQVTQCRDAIRLGLIGGNHALVDGVEVEVGPVRAKQLVDAYCCPARPLGETAAIAWRVLAVMIYGREPETDGPKREVVASDG